MVKQKVALMLNSQSLAAVDEWLDEMEAEYGPVPQELLDWAAQIFDAWEADKSDSAASSREPD